MNNLNNDRIQKKISTMFLYFYISIFLYFYIFIFLYFYISIFLCYLNKMEPPHPSRDKRVTEIN